MCTPVHRLYDSPFAPYTIIIDKWCPVSRITTPLARKRPFHWILIKSMLVRAARKTSNFQN